MLGCERSYSLSLGETRNMGRKTSCRSNGKTWFVARNPSWKNIRSSWKSINDWFLVFPWSTIWLFNRSPWKDPPMLLIGKPSIFMGHHFPWRTVSHNQRVIPLKTGELNSTPVKKCYSVSPWGLSHPIRKNQGFYRGYFIPKRERMMSMSGICSSHVQLHNML